MVQVEVMYVSQQKHIALVGRDTELINEPINSVIIICFLFIYLMMLNDQGRRSHFTQESAVRQRVRNEQYFTRRYTCESFTFAWRHHVFHVALDTADLTLRRLMSYIYIYMEHPFLMFLDHTQRRSTVGRTPLDE